MFLEFGTWTKATTYTMCIFSGNLELSGAQGNMSFYKAFFFTSLHIPHPSDRKSQPIISYYFHVDGL